MTVQTALKPWGNSQGILIPAAALRKLNWKSMDKLEIVVEEDRITISKPFEHKSFEERLAAYGGKIEICEYDFGEPQGREML